MEAGSSAPELRQDKAATLVAPQVFVCTSFFGKKVGTALSPTVPFLAKTAENCGFRWHQRE
jgi:hypothetical protein